MKKNVLMILALVMASLTNVQGAPVKKAEALQIAREFLQAKGLQVSDNMRLSHSSFVRRNNESIPSYYVFNNGDNEGFVIVAGDDRANVILGYSDTGSFDPANMPENMLGLFDDYSYQIQSLEEQAMVDTEVDGTHGYHAPTAGVTAPIEPMITSAWGQMEPYNQSCPASGNVTSGVGCVGVAMGQLMYFYKNRMVKKTQANIDSYTKGGVNVKGTPAGTKIDWVNMLDRYVGTETEAQKQAVADFLFYCGSSVKSTYHIGGATSASTSNVQAAMTDVFGMFSGSRYLRRYDYSYNDWMSMIYNELLNGRPVFYAGSNSNAAHAMVVDGFDGDQYYHINWGWNGTCNGYFLLSALYKDDPEGYISGYSNGYCNYQYAIVGLQPTNGLQLEECDPVLTASFSSVNTVSGYTSLKFYNYTYESGTYSYGLAVMDSNGNLKVLGTPKENVTISMGGYTTYTMTLTAALMKNLKLSKGNYKIVPVSKSSTENFWRKCISLKDGYITLTYNPSTSSISNIVQHPVENLVATKIDLAGSKIMGAEQPVRVTITNNGDDFSGVIYLLASQKKGIFSGYVGTCGLFIPAGATRMVEILWTPAKSGTWYLGASVDPTGSTNMGYSSFTIVAGSASRELAVQEVTINNVGEQNAKKFWQVYGTALTGTVKIKNNGSTTFAGPVSVILRTLNEEGGTEFTQESVHHNLLLAKGETVELPINFTGLDQTVYRYTPVFYYSPTYSNNSSVAISGNKNTRYTMVPGVMCYDSNGNITATAPTSPFNVPADATSVDLSGVTGANGVTKVNPNNNPNTLYFLGAGDTTPSGLAGKNVVKDGKASSISLTDLYDFVSPLTFKATTITYRRTPTIAAKPNGGWTTIALPFKVSKVETADGKQLDWFHNGSESGKNFWLKEFVGTNENVVLFDYVDEIEGGKPYIFAVPGSQWGEEWNLVNKKIYFIGYDQTMTADAKIMTGSSVYNFVGATYKSNVNDVWVLNDAGSKFVYGNYTNYPFRAYFKERMSLGSAPDNLVVEDMETGIFIPMATENEVVDVFNLNGMKVASAQVVNGQVNLETLPNGVYVIKGMKFVK